jgi:hypothetical protein
MQRWSVAGLLGYVMTTGLQKDQHKNITVNLGSPNIGAVTLMIILEYFNAMQFT